jgi:uncharacterized protein YndB with AHSA1/START domain
MRNTGALKVSTPTDREIRMVRTFDAPRGMVWDAFTRCDLLRRWFGPHGHTLVVCEGDFRAGGGWRFVIRAPDGQDLGMRGAIREMKRPERLVHIETFDDYPGEALVTTNFVEQQSTTIVTIDLLYESKQIRDAVVSSGMEHGAAESYDRLAEYLLASSLTTSAGA